MADRVPCLWVLAGANGAGKSSIGGALLRESGGDYFNPDEVARALLEREPSLGQTRANAAAWTLGVRLLDEALETRQDYFFETTLGGATMTQRLGRAIQTGYEVRIWYAGLASPELHLARIRSRVRKGGHDIPERDVRRRYDSSRRNLILLLPDLTELKVYDNSADAEPAHGKAPRPKLVLHCRAGNIVSPRDLRRTPEWAKPIVARAIASLREMTGKG